MTNPPILDAEQRLAGVIGQIVVENAKLGAAVDRLQAELQQTRARAEAAERIIRDIEARSQG